MTAISVIVAGASPWSADPAADDLNLRTALALAERLGGRYDVIVPAGPSRAAARTTDHGEVRVHRIVARTRTGFALRARRTLDGLARTSSDTPRVLMSSDPLAALIVETSRARRTLPHLFQVQGEILDPGPEYGGRLKRLAIARATGAAVRRSSGVRVVSEGLRQAIEPMTDRPVVVVGSRVDTEVFTPRPAVRSADACPRADAIMLGSLVEVKNHATVVRAWSQVVRVFPQARLLVVGDGYGRRRLTALVDALALGPNVRFLGAVPHRRVAGLLAGAGCLVHPSWSEGQPRAVLEGMACGLPVLCSDIPAHREIVPPFAGRLVPPGDVAAWASAVTGVLRDPAGAAEMGRRGRALVLERHDFTRNIDRYAGFIREIAAGGRTGELVL